MPLLVLTGLPCSGKTYRASQIAAEFQSRIHLSGQSSPQKTHLQVHIVSSHHATLDSILPSTSVPTSPSPRDQIYNSANAEKTARAEEFSAIKRALSKDTIVIADGLNYIKGYRYQLWCEAKAAGTRCVVVHVASREEECVGWNDARLRVAGREEEAEAAQHTSGTADKAVLVPESHTAIYGDKFVSQDARSRSFSIDGQLDASGTSKLRDDDGTTLKSLYLSDRPTNIREQAKPQQDVNEGQLAPSQPYPLPSTTPPPPFSTQAYTPTTLKSLIARYEPPSPFSRWDTPLFVIPTSDIHPPYDEIWNAVFPPPTIKNSKKTFHGTSNTVEEGQAVKRHQSTILPAATRPDALQVFESCTATVIAALLKAYRQQELGDSGGVITFSVPNAGQEDGIHVEVSLPPGMNLSQPTLQRLRRKYTQLQRGGIAHGVGVVHERKDVVSGFVRFLNAELEGGE